MRVDGMLTLSEKRNAGLGAGASRGATGLAQCAIP
jgi:hypothetical protein